MKKSYSEKLRDPRWQKMRLQIMERDKFACQFCYATRKTLNVHHKYYNKGAAPWEYDEAVLVTCCEGCHERAEHLRKVAGFTIGNQCGMRLVNSFLILIQRNQKAMDFIMTQMMEDTKLTDALVAVAGMYESGYDARCKEEADESREEEETKTIPVTDSRPAEMDTSNVWSEILSEIKEMSPFTAGYLRMCQLLELNNQRVVIGGRCDTLQLVNNKKTISTILKVIKARSFEHSSIEFIDTDMKQGA